MKWQFGTNRNDKSLVSAVEVIGKRKVARKSLQTELRVWPLRQSSLRAFRIKKKIININCQPALLPSPAQSMLRIMHGLFIYF